MRNESIADTEERNKVTQSSKFLSITTTEGNENIKNTNKELHSHDKTKTGKYTK